jgi:hypothetical protein
MTFTDPPPVLHAGPSAVEHVVAPAVAHELLHWLSLYTPMFALEQPPPATDPQVHVHVSGGNVSPKKPSNASSL